MRPPAAKSPRPLALVTGASAGIGAAFARAYAARGFDLALVARRADRLEALAAELSAAHAIEAFAIPADLAAFDACASVLAAVAARGRVVDALVNNAGFSIAQSFTGVPWSRQRDFLMTLVVNACGLAHGAIPGMVARGRGSIVNVGSMAAFAPGVAGHSLYPGAKSLMVSWSQSLAAELKGSGVKVTVTCPGFTLTEFAEANGTKAVMDAAPRRFFQTAEQVVATTLAANDRGQVVVVPGLHNKIAAAVLRYAPQPLLIAILSRASAKYHLES
ncbi:MAG TPA: SDR family NAD(P)-dependent oxidoreductase [Phenylobacterium sp.]|jgi:short-subunit dehydrogenase|uniref:SDR family NAD(P)-dependent oxidoreductase n=1 Tax=Phenylobacterium sp. TaxID=1871053 RepID=UPI002C2D0DDA|nr:SDR family NAD(P)-dependent oxidoreductase [Phenylobacterium sp.]HXA39004.1 SDR family NAD(P)-dependent oxidoreductase [Phenylobacterium sp.]